MKKILISLFALFSLINTVSAKPEKAIGQIIKPDKKLNLPYDYYITLQKSDGKVLAFPVKSAKVKLDLMYKNKFYLLQFEPSTETLTIGEKKQKFTVINLLRAKYLTLKDLQADKNTENIEKGKPKAAQGKPDLRINDKLTNAVILTAGAILLGSMLAN
jgi:hypothetical protein